MIWAIATVLIILLAILMTGGFEHTSRKLYVDKVGPEGGIKLGEPIYHEGWLSKLYRRIF